MRLHIADPRRRARFACALAITVLVGVFSYGATFRALVVISTPSGASAGTTSVTPGGAHTTQTPVSTPTADSVPSR